MPLNFTSLGKFLTGELALYDPSFIDIVEDDLWMAAGFNVPSVGDLPFGIEEINGYRREFIGEASTYDGRSYDIPLVDAGIAGSKIKAIMVVAGAEWSMADVQRNQLARQIQMLPDFNLVDAKMEAVNISINRRIHRLGLVGMPTIGFYGMFNATAINTIDQTATNVYGLTPAQLYDWMKTVIAQFKVSSKLNYNQIIIYVDDTLYTALCVPLGDNTGDTPYMRLVNPDRGQFVGDIRPVSELQPATLVQLGVEANTTRGKLIMGDFNNNRSVIRHFTPMDRTDPFPKDTGIHYGVTGWSGTSEIHWKVPERFTYVRYATV